MAARNRWIRWSISTLTVVVCVIVLLWVARLPAPARDVPPQEEVIVEVAVMPVTARAEVADVLRLPAVLEPFLVVEVPAEQRGQIEEQFVAEGERVEVGARLLRLDTDLLETALQRAQAQVDFDELTRRRLLELLERGVARRSELDEVEARLKVNRALLQEARTNLERATVYAPVSGILDEWLRETGEFVNVGDPVARIVDVSKVKVRVQVPERDVPYIKLGREVKVRVDALGGRLFTGRVTYVSATASAGSRTTPVEITLDNSSGVLHPGMIVRTEATRRVLRDVVMIPLSAVVPMDDERVVYVEEDGVAERRTVELGILQGTAVQVVAGLSPGDRLIVKGQRLVGPGQKVAVIREVSSDEVLAEAAAER
ncbi:MAG: efflux RND transporter periplasmic adaptor subunit [Acidobacteriota bacterium]